MARADRHLVLLLCAVSAVWAFTLTWQAPHAPLHLRVASFGLLYFLLLVVNALLCFLVALADVLFVAALFRSERYDLGCARRAARRVAALLRSGPVTVWWDGRDEVGPRLLTQVEAAHGSYRRLTGGPAALSRPLRLLCFAHRADRDAYLWHSLTHGTVGRPNPYDWLPPRRVLLCEDESRADPDGLEAEARYWVGGYLCRDRPELGRLLWLREGISRILAASQDDGELGRLLRKVRLYLAQGAVTTKGRLLRAVPFRMALRWNRGRDHANFTYVTEFSIRSWSLVEYLGGRGATPERRSQFQAFLAGLRPEGFLDRLRTLRDRAVFRRHFGCGYGQLLAEWRTWVLDSADDVHVDPADPVKTRLDEKLLPVIRDCDAHPDLRLAAIRTAGSAGYAWGADALIDVLEEEDGPLGQAAGWALESIAGRPLGQDVAAWRAWWLGLARRASVPAPKPKESRTQIQRGANPGT
jgi:hypothetical protein